MDFYRTSQAMAKRRAPHCKRIDQQASHSMALELVAHQLGYKDWNTAYKALLPAQVPQTAVTFTKPFRSCECSTKPRRGSSTSTSWASAWSSSIVLK